MLQKSARFMELTYDVEAQSVPPLNVKKLRRRALISGVPLVLPESPVMPPMANSTPSTSLTFTANWDATLHEFSFTPVSPGCPSPSPSPRFVASPVPHDVDADPDDVESNYFSVPVSHPRRSFSTSSSSSSSDDSDSLFSHSRKVSSASTAPSTVIDEPIKASASNTLAPPPITIDLFSREAPRSSFEARKEKPKPAPLKTFDEDMLTPWSAFEQSCWETLDQPFTVQLRPPSTATPYAIADQRKSSFDKPLPDVPVDSMFFDEVRPRLRIALGRYFRSDSLAQNDLSPTRSTNFKPSASPGRRLRAHFHKLFGSMHRHL